MPKKQTVYLHDETLFAIETLGLSSSAAIRRIVERYTRITNHSMPDLDEEEWAVIYDIVHMNGQRVDQALRLWAIVAESNQDHFGISLEKLSKKLKALPEAGRYAVWDWAVRYWQFKKQSRQTSKEK